MRGAWWSNEAGDYELPVPASPPANAGVQAMWRRDATLAFPKWADVFLDDVKKRGLPHYLKNG
jgi:hypothetical protein